MPGFFKYFLSLSFILAISTKASPQSNIEWPAAIVEMHYNNTGPDVNEYIEIHGYYMNSPFYFPVILDRIDELRFFDNLGELYKTLPIVSMQFYNAGGWGNYGPHNFAYYQFPPGENFADAGKVQLINIFSGVTTIIAEYVYNGAGITEYRYIRPLAPRFFPVGENETTPAGLSLNFCGYYYSAGWSASIMASSYGANNACLILPVSFTTFDFTLLNTSVRLNWQTASESNTDRFEIERSTNGVNFSKIGTVASTGAGNTAKDYSFQDNNPAAINYYRLKQIDKDGKESYSKTLLVKFKGGNPLTVESTIVADRLMINIGLQQHDIRTVQVYDLSGKMLVNLRGRSGYNEINVSGFSAGGYFIRLQTKVGGSYSQRFVKQ